VDETPVVQFEGDVFGDRAISSLRIWGDVGVGRDALGSGGADDPVDDRCGPAPLDPKRAALGTETVVEAAEVPGEEPYSSIARPVPQDGIDDEQRDDSVVVPSGCRPRRVVCQAEVLAKPDDTGAHFGGPGKKAFVDRTYSS
jgi:hypothetical protein